MYILFQKDRLMKQMITLYNFFNLLIIILMKEASILDNHLVLEDNE